MLVSGITKVYFNEGSSCHLGLPEDIHEFFRRLEHNMSNLISESWQLPCKLNELCVGGRLPEFDEYTKDLGTIYI